MRRRSSYSSCFTSFLINENYYASSSTYHFLDDLFSYFSDPSIPFYHPGHHPGYRHSMHMGPPGMFMHSGPHFSPSISQAAGQPMDVSDKGYRDMLESHRKRRICNEVCFIKLLHLSIILTRSVVVGGRGVGIHPRYSCVLKMATKRVGARKGLRP